MKTLGILTHSFHGWEGGRSYLRLLLTALKSVSMEKNFRLYILTNPFHFNGKLPWFRKQMRSIAKRFWKSGTLLEHGKNGPLSDLEIPTIIFDHYDLDAVARKFSIDCAGFLTDPRLLQSKTPAIGYIYDCQHRHYPQFFDAEERVHRDTQFAGVVRHGIRVLASSLNAKTDVINFFGALPDSVSAMPFTSHVDFAQFPSNDRMVLEKYKLPKRYFVICNRFYRHKDHATAFKAFACFLRASADLDFELVCTGEMDDSVLADELKHLACDLQVSSKVRFLGRIERAEQLSTMKNATALIQPSLFEGTPGGLSVSEAVAMGVPVIASDIPVNKEITNGNRLFFQTGNAASLAEKMILTSTQTFLRPSDDELKQQANVSLKRLGNHLYETCFPND